MRSCSGLHAERPAFYKKSIAYLHWDRMIPLCDLITSIPRKDFESPKSFISNWVLNVLLSSFIEAKSLLEKAMQLEPYHQPIGHENPFMDYPIDGRPRRACAYFLPFRLKMSVALSLAFSASINYWSKRILSKAWSSCVCLCFGLSLVHLCWFREASQGHRLKPSK